MSDSNSTNQPPEPEDPQGALRTKVLIGGIVFLFISIFVLIGLLVIPQLRK